MSASSVAPAPSSAPSPAAMEAANVNPVTGLATDYLNVFNEGLMLIGLAGDCPETVSDLMAWEPMDYETHFERSGFQAKDIAIAAYRAADPAVRAPFDAAAEALGVAMLCAAEDLKATIDDGLDAAEHAGVLAMGLRDDIAALDAMIHGRDTAAVTAQDAIDALFD